MALDRHSFGIIICIGAGFYGIGSLRLSHGSVADHPRRVGVVVPEQDGLHAPTQTSFNVTGQHTEEAMTANAVGVH